MYDQEKLELAAELHRLRRISRELVDILRRDATLFARVSRRTKRWIARQDQLIKEEKDANDAVALLIKRRRSALAKLTLADKKLLGLDDPKDETEN